jgi:predicted GNAT family acetyltransferase
MMETTGLEIEHQPSRQRFVCEVDGDTSVLEYVMLTDRRIDFRRTFVPESLRGRGIAERLVRTGLAWAREQGYLIEASCWYARRFLRGRDG